MPLFHMKPEMRMECTRFFKENSTEGLMGKREVEAILTKHNVKNVTPAQVQQVIELVSLNGQGISLEGFLNYIAFYNDVRDQDSEILDAFRCFDVDGDGSISRDEVKYMATLLDLKIDWKTLIAEVDQDSDGKIDFNEFCDMMRKQAN